MRALPASPALVLMTAFDQPDLPERAARCGAAACLLKPFQGTTLIETLNNVIAAARRRRGLTAASGAPITGFPPPRALLGKTFAHPCNNLLCCEDDTPMYSGHGFIVWNAASTLSRNFELLLAERLTAQPSQSPGHCSHTAPEARASRVTKCSATNDIVGIVPAAITSSSRRTAIATACPVARRR